MLACSNCHGALAITIPANLSSQALQNVCRTYRTKLAMAHEEQCPFRWDAELHLVLLKDETANATKNYVPTSLASVLPPKTVQLLEHPFPSFLLRSSVQKLEASCPKEGGPWRFPILELSPELRDVRLPSLKLNLDTTADQLIRQAPQQLGMGYNSSVALALFGWIPIGTQSTANPPIVTVGCPLCLAWIDMRLELLQNQADSTNEKETEYHRGGEEEESSSRPSKRSKISARKKRFSNPWTNHRHYCPMVCGFPTDTLEHDTPAWQTILSRLYQKEVAKYDNPTRGQDDKEEDLDAELNRFQKILQSGISSKKSRATDFQLLAEEESNETET